MNGMDFTNLEELLRKETAPRVISDAVTAVANYFLRAGPQVLEQFESAQAEQGRGDDGMCGGDLLGSGVPRRPRPSPMYGAAAAELSYR